MLAKALLNPILNNDALTRGLGDAEARMLVEWLVEQAERRAAKVTSKEAVEQLIERMRRRARAIGRFVGLWCHEGQRGAACQLAGAERFNWPLPNSTVDPCELMQEILTWEAQQVAA